MSILDAEQSARYIDSLVASVQALEADLAATRDKLRQAAGKCADHECRIDRLDAIRVKWESLMGSTPWRLAGLGYERAYTKFNADRKPENDPADVIRWLLNRADLYDSEKQRAGQAEANFEQAQARIAALEQERDSIRADNHRIVNATRGLNAQIKTERARVALASKAIRLMLRYFSDTSDDYRWAEWSNRLFHDPDEFVPLAKVEAALAEYGTWLDLAL